MLETKEKEAVETVRYAVENLNAAIEVCKRLGLRAIVISNSTNMYAEADAPAITASVTKTLL